LLSEQVIYWLRKTVDDLIGLHHVLAYREETGCYPRRVAPDSIGRLLQQKDVPPSAAPVSIDPCVLASRHETIFEGSQIEGALSGRLRQTQGGGSQDLLGVDAHHKAWLKRRRESGDVEPELIPGRPPRKGAMLQLWLPMHLEANDDLTLEEHREAFEEEFGQTISTSTVGRAIASLPHGGWPLKKVTDSLRAR
jgi:hypothetical protein